MRWLALMLVFALVGCNAYAMGSLLRDAHGTADPRSRSVACLDMRLHVVTARYVSANPVIEIEMGNRCASPVRVDLRAIRVVAHGDDGVDQPLDLYDPRGEVHAIALDGRKRATVQMQYVDRWFRQLGEDVTVLADFAHVNVDTRVPPTATDLIAIGRWQAGAVARD